MIKRTASVLAAALFAASFGQGLLNDVAAAQTALRPIAKPAATPAQAAPVQQNSDAALSAQQPDLAFGAFQRGYFLTAFAIATKRAVDDNDIKAMTLLGELYADGLGVAQDDKKAAEWYKFAASRGDSNAMFALAMFSLNGRAGPRDRQASAQWLAAAAKLGHPLAAYDLALLYIEGQLFPQDFARAAQLLRVAADAGNPDAQYALGTFYKVGRGVPQDMHEAVQLWEKAALADNVDAQVEYAIALFNGDGIDRNEAAAAAIFRKAAMHGSAIAQDRLARILADGEGVAADPIEATKWHLISRAGGETDLELDAFMEKLDPNVRSAGEAAAKPWLDAMQAAREARGKAAQAQQPPAPAKQ